MTTKNNPPKVIFIGGPMGSGKTTAGKLLSDLIKYEFIEGDDFHSEEMKQKMAAGIPLNDEDRRPWLMSLAALWQNNPEKKMVIACSALKKYYRELLLGGKELKENVKMVLLKVDEEKLRERLVYRAKYDPSHFASQDLLPSQLEAFELPIGTEWSVDEPNVYVLESNNISAKTAKDIQELFFSSLIHKMD